MKSHFRAASFLCCFTVALLVVPALAGSHPETRQSNQVDDFFGTPVADPYRWLENVDDKEVHAWVAERNAVRPDNPYLP